MLASYFSILSSIILWDCHTFPFLLVLFSRCYRVVAVVPALSLPASLQLRGQLGWWLVVAGVYCLQLQRVAAAAGCRLLLLLLLPVAGWSVPLGLLLQPGCCGAATALLARCMLVIPFECNNLIIFTVL